MLRDFKVTLEVPQGATVGDVKEYIDRAVRCECGSLPTYDPMFNLNKKTIVVKQILKQKKKKPLVIYYNDPNAMDDYIYVTLFNCPSCECSVHNGSKFCSHCGSRLIWKINKEWSLNA